MNKIYFLLLASILAFSIEGRVFRVIDNFSDASYLARYVPTPAETYDNTAPFYWFSPYANPVGHGPGAPFANFRTATNVIGGQRDVIIGHYSTMETLASVSCFFNQKMQIAFPTSFVGSVYVQYDGVDNGSGLGARLGNNIGGDAGAGSNADGTVDFTFGGQARGIQFSINSDLPISVELKVKNLEDDSTVEDFGNSLTVTVQNNEIVGFTRYYFTFDDSAWSDSTFDWTRVAGFQFKVFTEPGSPTIQSTDVEVISIQIGAFTVGGTVSNDCLCDNASLGPLAGTRVNLFDTSVSTTEPLAFTTTDANGDYSFSQEFSSTSGFLSTTTPYRICLDDTSLVRCSGTQPSNANGCYDFFTSGNPYVDLLDFDFTIARTILLEIPSPVNNVECGVGSTDPSNTGYAFVTDCDGIRTQLNVWSDVVTGSSCVRNIIRTWTDTNSNQSGTQLIRVFDTLPPVFNVPVQSLSQPCDSVTISLSQWLNNQGNAVVTDACAAGLVTFTNNYSGQPLIGCGTSATVTFTFHDGCGRFATQTATYTIEEAVSAEPCVPICGSIEENTVNNAQLTVEGQGVGFNLATSCAASPYAIFTFNSGSFNYVFLSTASYGGWGNYDLFLQKQGVNQCNAATQFKAYGRLLQTTVDQNSVYYIYIGLGAETNPNSGFLLQGSVAPPPQNDLCTNSIDIGTLIQDESIYVSGTTIGATNGDGQAGMSSSVYYNFFSGEVEDIFVTTCYPGSTTFDITIHVGYNNLADTNTCPGGYEGCFWECGHNLHYGVDISCPPEGNTQAGYGVYRDSIPLQRNRNYFIEVGRHPYARGNQFGNGDFTFVIGSGTLCIPNCAGKQCGDNGCGGQCGTCANDESCNAQGTCEITQVLPVTLATAVELTILPNSDQTINVNNVYDVSTENPESPNDPCFTGTSNPIWYHIAPSVYQRTITISTCDTLVDTVLGAFLPDGTRIECNDDRDSSAPAGDCNGSSSYIQFINNPNTDFYIVISSFSPSDTGDIDLRIESRIEIEDLIEESTTIIVNSLIQQVATLTGDLTNQISAVNSNVDAQVGSVLSAIGTLSTSVDNQFTQVGGSITALQQAIQTDIATSSSSLSSQISALSGLLSDTPDSLPAIAATVGTISANVASLQNDVDSLTDDVSAVNGIVTTISGTLNVVSNGVSDLNSDIESLSADLDEQSSLIGTLQTNVGNGISSVNNNIDSLSDSVTAEFGGVTDSLTAINGIALNILEDVAEGNVVGNNIYDFIRSAYYETYLLAGSNALDSIPWKWRTPAAANGSMDDILAYLTSLYNSKLAACQGVSNTNCNSFRQNATPAFSSLLTSYNNQVSALKYKKAFQVLQGFYTKLFPTTLWV